MFQLIYLWCFLGLDRNVALHNLILFHRYLHICWWFNGWSSMFHLLVIVIQLCFSILIVETFFIYSGETFFYRKWKSTRFSLFVFFFGGGGHRMPDLYSPPRCGHYLFFMCNHSLCVYIYICMEVLGSWFTTKFDHSAYSENVYKHYLFIVIYFNIKDILKNSLVF